MHSRTQQMHRYDCPLGDFDAVDRLFLLAMLAGLAVIATLLALNLH